MFSLFTEKEGGAQQGTPFHQLLVGFILVSGGAASRSKDEDLSAEWAGWSLLPYLLRIWKPDTKNVPLPWWTSLMNNNVSQFIFIPVFLSFSLCHWFHLLSMFTIKKTDIFTSFTALIH